MNRIGRLRAAASRPPCASFKTHRASSLLLGSGLRGLQTRAESTKVPPLAFTFDIDGVLLRGEDVLPQALRALKILDGDNPFGAKIPYILMTNGGGVSEDERCRRLSKQLGYPISTSQYIQAHTVLKSVSKRLENDAVLVLGGRPGVCRAVAETYGFKNVYTTLDVLAWNPSVWPFHDLDKAELDSVRPTDFSQTPIRAVLVFHDPRNWALDVQVTIDVLRARGIVGGPYLPHPSFGNAQEEGLPPPVELVFCNPDLIWRSDFPRSRMGQGAFKEAFQAVYKAMTGEYYPHIQYGKPTSAAYQYAEEVLKNRLKEVSGHEVAKLPSVYMVGDNPESDIAGANAAGWSSILVHTGVYEPASGPPKHTPTAEASDVEAAVRWAIDHEVHRLAA